MIDGKKITKEATGETPKVMDPGDIMTVAEQSTIAVRPGGQVKLTVELDSYRYHRSRHAWELDRKREREAYARGDQFRRFTWGDIGFQLSTRQVWPS